jgi:membrane-bound lytic murein transglycosylase D
MTTVIRMARLALLGMVGLVAAPGLLAEELPRPAELQPAVDFWKRVYTDIDSDEGVIHDRYALERVYTTVSMPRDLLASEERHRIDEARERLETALFALADQDGEPDNALQRKIRPLFAEDAQASDFRDAAGQLRFQRGLSDRFQAGYQRSGRWYDHIQAELREHGVPAGVAALPHVESSFRTQVTSHAWAVGLWQFTRLTGGDYMRVDHIVDERRDPWRSSEAAAELLADAYESLDDWALAITAYNHGITGMHRAVKAVGEPSIARIIQEYEGRNFGFASRNFYPAFLAAVDVDRNASKHFGPIERVDAAPLVTVEVPDFTEASALVDALPATEQRLRKLNRALRDPVWTGRKYVPAGYTLRVPAKDAQAVRQAIEDIALTRRYTAQRPDREHRVRAGQTLSGIAKRYGVATSTLAAANNLHDADYLRQGQVLRLPVAGAQPVSLAAKLGEGKGVYTVQSGDTLSGIAQRHDLSVQTLAELNGLEDADYLRPGQRLQVRKGASLSQVTGQNPGEG